MRSPEQIQKDYLLYRGNCLEFVEEICRVDSSLRMIRGHYFCRSWGTNEQHWWAIRTDGSIVDPTAAQFPCNGSGEYEPFNGIVECSQCGVELSEAEAKFDGRYSFCSSKCNMKFVGLI